MNQFAPLNINLLEQRVEMLPLVRKIVYLDETTSTNDLAKQLSKKGEYFGTLIIAERQTAGRGRRTKRWFSIEGRGLYFTLIIEVPVIQNLQLLTLAAGVAVAGAIEAVCGLNPGLKWPNDVYVNDKKLAGILTESISGGSGSMIVILGVGINVNHEPDDFTEDLSGTATSLKILTEKVVSREDILVEFLKRLTYVYQEIIEGKGAEVIKLWLEKALFIGKEVIVTRKNTTIRGEFVGLNEEGAMILKDRNQKLHQIWSADAVRCPSI